PDGAPAGRFLHQLDPPDHAGPDPADRCRRPACRTHPDPRASVRDHRSRQRRRPKLVEVGGGVTGLEVRLVEARSTTYVLVHLLVDVRDAMGANAVNTMAEAVSSAVAAIAGGDALL